MSKQITKNHVWAEGLAGLSLILLALALLRWAAMPHYYDANPLGFVTAFSAAISGTIGWSVLALNYGRARMAITAIMIFHLGLFMAWKFIV